MIQPPRILFKYPTRGRVERFFEGLDSIVNNLYDKDSFEIQVTADADDPTMAKQEIFERIKTYPNTNILYGISHSKIDAVNRDMPLFDKWDVVVVMSDDMRFTFYGFDEILRQEFADGDFDKYLHIPDQDAKHILATMYIAGRGFYHRFGYIYHPSYKSLWCDNEIQEVAKKLGRYKFVDCIGLIQHLNPAYGHLPKDEMLINQQLHWGDDEANFNARKAKNFDL
jgi:hypothetical protein